MSGGNIAGPDDSFITSIQRSFRLIKEAPLLQEIIKLPGIAIDPDF